MKGIPGTGDIPEPDRPESEVNPTLAYFAGGLAMFAIRDLERMLPVREIGPFRPTGFEVKLASGLHLRVTVSEVPEDDDEPK